MCERIVEGRCRAAGRLERLVGVSPPTPSRIDMMKFECKTSLPPCTVDKYARTKRGCWRSDEVSFWNRSPSRSESTRRYVGGGDMCPCRFGDGLSDMHPTSSMVSSYLCRVIIMISVIVVIVNLSRPFRLSFGLLGATMRLDPPLPPH